MSDIDSDSMFGDSSSDEDTGPKLIGAKKPAIDLINHAKKFSNIEEDNSDDSDSFVSEDSSSVPDDADLEDDENFDDIEEEDKHKEEEEDDDDDDNDGQSGGDDDDDDDEDEEEKDEDDKEASRKKKPSSSSSSSKKSSTNNNSSSTTMIANNDDDDDDYDEYDESYLQKFDQELNKNFIHQFHPECFNHNSDEIKMLAQVIRDANGDIIDPLHRTIPTLTKYEKTRILGQRAKQIEVGARPFVNVDPKIIDSALIAELELKEKKLPFIIKRPIPGGAFEYWHVKDLEDLNF